jgi:glutamyl-tRNA reductase
VVVVAAASEGYLITPETLGACEPGVGPRCFVDLAHPRSVDPAIVEREGVTMIDLEDVFGQVEASRRSRAAQVPMAETLVEEEAESFMRWLRLRENAVVVKALRSHVLERALGEAERYAGRVPEEQREHLRRLARSIARSILHRPTTALRDADPASEEGRSLLRHGPALFGVADDTSAADA